MVGPLLPCWRPARARCVSGRIGRHGCRPCVEWWQAVRNGL